MKNSVILNCLIEKEKELQSELNKVRLAIDACSDTNILSKIFYDPQNIYRNKIQIVLLDINQVKTTKEILNLILDREPELDQGKTYNTISGNLSVMCKEGILIQHKEMKMKGYYYGLKKWFDENGVLMGPYKPKLDNHIIQIK